MTHESWRSKNPSIKRETPEQRQRRIELSILDGQTRLNGTDLTPTTDHLKPVNKQKRSGGHNHHSHPPQKP